MSEDCGEFTGEFHHSLKGFKIPLKANDPSICDNPPPPGTIEIPLATTTDTDEYISPLASAYQVPKQKFETSSSIPPKALSNPKTNHEPSNNTGATKHKSLFTMPSAIGLPEDLIKLFKPLFCDLCSTKLNSPSSARLHYESKNHEKKINAWLSEWSIKTGEPVPKRQIIDKGPTGPNALHCDICDLPLTSTQHAKQHYMGRKHKNALAGRGKPGGSGYYDANNKWVRTSKTPEDDPTNRFSIGESFLKQPETIIVPESVLNEPPPPPPPLPDQMEQQILSTNFVPNLTHAIANSFDISANDLIQAPEPIIVPQIQMDATAADLSKYCDVCDISVTSEMHMRLHLNGAKHAKKLRQLGEPPHTDGPDTLSQCIMNESTTTKRPKHNPIGENMGNTDFSVFRTPSGQYYCQVCDLSVTSEVTLSQHFNSKRHIRTMSMSKRK